MRYDLAVIGSGAAGFAAAIAASGMGRSVVMIERGTVGGTCVNTGCVPSKALLAAAASVPAAPFNIEEGTPHDQPGRAATRCPHPRAVRPA